MPVPQLKKMADKHGVSLSTAERAWTKAKKEALKSYKKDSPEYWGTVTKITKNMLQAKHEFLQEEDLEDITEELFINEGILAKAFGWMWATIKANKGAIFTTMVAQSVPLILFIAKAKQTQVEREFNARIDVQKAKAINWYIKTPKGKAAYQKHTKALNKLKSDYETAVLNEDPDKMIELKKKIIEQNKKGIELMNIAYKLHLTRIEEGYSKYLSGQLL
jgi:hypothetical protein